jgi:hypothetical protein
MCRCRRRVEPRPRLERAAGKGIVKTVSVFVLVTALQAAVLTALLQEQAPVRHRLTDRHCPLQTTRIYGYRRSAILRACCPNGAMQPFSTAIVRLQTPYRAVFSGWPAFSRTQYCQGRHPLIWATRPCVCSTASSTSRPTHRSAPTICFVRSETRTGRVFQTARAQERTIPPLRSITDFGIDGSSQKEPLISLCLCVFVVKLMNYPG